MCWFPGLEGMLRAGIRPSGCAPVGPRDAGPGSCRRALPRNWAPEHRKRGCGEQGASGITLPALVIPCPPAPGISQALATRVQLR